MRCSRRASSGSSPRLRGTRPSRSARTRAARFIPAPAGNTTSPSIAMAKPPVHPRACGEHQCGAVDRGLVCGSSPRLRGTRRSELIPAMATRFIPAPAGNTCEVIWRPWATPVHPRACGEHSPRLAILVSTCGSSPRLRGTLQVGEVGLDPGRFIPAPAGNTTTTLAVLCLLAVHPRACGEHWRVQARCVNAGGSSPRLRGTRVGEASVRCPNRFIPAPAGNTVADNPITGTPSGSSPRLRGTRRHSG